MTHIMQRFIQGLALAVLCLAAGLKAPAQGIIVTEVDGSPRAQGRIELIFDNGTVTSQAGGRARITNSGGGAAEWGSITGTLGDQTDLLSALDLKLTIADIASADDLAALIAPDTEGTGSFVRAVDTVLTGNTDIQRVSFDDLSPVVSALGTIAGAGTATLQAGIKYYTATFSGSTATVALPASPTDGAYVLDWLSTYGAGTQTITVPSLVRPALDPDTAVTSYTVPSSAGAYGRTVFYASGGGFVKFDVIGDNTSPPASAATTMTVAGTANEIASSAGAQDLSANRTWTLSLPATIDLGGKTSLEIPNSDDPDVDAAGETSWDTDGWMRGYDGANQVAIGEKIRTVQVTVIAPNDLADAQRDAFLFWSNETGMSFVVTGWKGWSGTDDTTLNLEVVDSDGVSNNATVDAIELATGSGPYTGSDTTITAATIANGRMLVLDFDDTDTPTYVKLTIYGYLAADVN